MVCSESASQFGNAHSLVMSKHLQANVLFKIYRNLFQSFLFNGLFRICQSIWQCPFKHVLCPNICRQMFYSKFTTIYFQSFLFNCLFRICQSIWQRPFKDMLCPNICRQMFYSKFTAIYFNLFCLMVCSESTSQFGNVHLSTCCVQTFVGKCFIQNLPQFISIFIIKWSVPNLAVHLAMST